MQSSVPAFASPSPSPAPLFIGVDVAKDTVVVACSQTSFAVCTIANTEPALRTFLQTLPAHSCIAMEATNTYHQALAELAHAAGMHVYVLNAKDVHYYARGVGLRAKTDQVDARLIARFLHHEVAHLPVWQPPTPAQQQIDQLLKRRARLVSHKSAVQLSCAQMACLKDQLAHLLASYDALLAAIDAQIDALMGSIPQRIEQVKRLTCIPGVGRLTGTWLANLLDRVALRNSDALVAFTGMDPRACESGQYRGRRRLSKRGPAEGRRLLYNAGMAAARSKHWAPLYAHYRQQGWPSTPAILMLARKILRIAFALYKTQSVFDPQRMPQGA